MDDRNATTQQRHLQAGYRRDPPRPSHHRRHPLTTSSQETQIRQGQGQDQRQGQRQDQEQILHVATSIQTTTLHQCVIPYPTFPPTPPTAQPAYSYGPPPQPSTYSAPSAKGQHKGKKSKPSTYTKGGGKQPQK